MCCGILFMRRSGRHSIHNTHSYAHERELWCCINENMDTEPLSIFAQLELKLEQWAYKWTHETQSPNDFKTRWREWKKKQLNHHVFKCGYSNFYSNLGSGILFFFVVQINCSKSCRVRNKSIESKTSGYCVCAFINMRCEDWEERRGYNSILFGFLANLREKYKFSH